MSRKILIHKDQARIIRGNIKRNIIPDRTLENLTFRCTFFPFNQGNWLVVLLVKIQSSQLVCHWENPWQLCSLSLSYIFSFIDRFQTSLIHSNEHLKKGELLYKPISFSVQRRLKKLKILSTQWSLSKMWSKCINNHLTRFMKDWSDG